jgi:hypothetical protein
MGRDGERPEPRVEGTRPPSAVSAPTRPRIVIDPASGLINPLSIFNSVVLIRAFPRRLTLRAASGNVDSLAPARLTLRATLRQSPARPPSRLGPSGCPAAWLPAPLCPISPKHSPRRSSKDTSLTAKNSPARRPCVESRVEGPESRAFSPEEQGLLAARASDVF